MDINNYLQAPFVDHVFHPTDLSTASETAFAHALAIALKRKSRLTILHVADEGGELDWSRFPAVRSTLERWGLLEKGAPRESVWSQLNLKVNKVALGAAKPLQAMLAYLDKHPTDLIVLATEGREGLPAWVRPSLAERLAREYPAMTLFVPGGSDGFVSSQDGALRLERILVPVDHEPSPRSAVLYAARAAVHAGGKATITLLHVGKKAPRFDVPSDPAITWEQVAREGEPVATIVEAARTAKADLVVMATAGRLSLADVLRGSVTEQVLRRSPCPLLAVPVR